MNNLKTNALLIALFFISFVHGQNFPSGQLKEEYSSFIGVTIDNDSIFIGKKVILLNFGYFACRPCMMKIPYLNNLYEKYHDKIQVITVRPHVASDIKIYQQNTDTSSVYYLIRSDFGYKKKAIKLYLNVTKEV